MADFMPLATWLARVDATPFVESVAGAPATEVDAREAGPVLRNVARDLALLRLATLEAFERTKMRLLELFATEVLGRELALAPSDVDALASRVLAAVADLEPVALVLSPSDASLASTALPIRVDANLAPGNFAVEVRDGMIESTFAFRLADVLDRCAS